MFIKPSNPFLLFFAGAILLLSSCSEGDNTESNSESNAKKQAKADKSELEGLLLSAPELTLEESIKKYAAGPSKNLTDKDRGARLTEAGGRAAEQGDNEAAEKLLSKAIELDDNNGMAHYLRGKVRCNGVMNNEQDAIGDLKKAIALGAGGSGPHQFLGHVYDSNNQPDLAVDSLTAAIKMEPNSKDVYKSRAALYTAMGQKEKALKDYDTLAKLDPESPLGPFRRAQVLESLKRNDEARVAYEKVVALDQPDAKVPLKAIALKRLAALNSARGKHKEAIENLTEAIKFDDTDDEPFRLRGLEYCTLKDYKKAADDLSRAIEERSNSVDNFSARADVYAKMGKPELAAKDRLEAKRLQDAPAERPLYELKRE